MILGRLDIGPIGGCLVAQFDLSTVSQSPIFWGLAVSAIGLWLALSNSGVRWRRVGQVIGGVGLVILAVPLPKLRELLLPKLSDLSTVEKRTRQIVFWLLSVPPIFWGLAVSAIGLWLALSNSGVRWRRVGQVIGGVGLVILAVALPKLSDLSTVEKWTEQIVFWLLSGIAVGCSAAAITARNPVYTAIWFAASLLGVAGLFLFQNAQFLGVATVVVYAGAIIVTFLFVLMLANPEGQAHYDRVSWAKFPVPLLVVSAAALVAAVSFFDDHPPPASASSPRTTASSDHMAHLGGELFAKHMVSVEVAGTILLVALVGAVAIVIQGRERRAAALPPNAESPAARSNA